MTQRLRPYRLQQQQQLASSKFFHQSRVAICIVASIGVVQIWFERVQQPPTVNWPSAKKKIDELRTLYGRKKKMFANGSTSAKKLPIQDNYFLRRLSRTNLS